MIYLPSLEQILRLHSKLVARTGGADGARDLGLIESALARANAGYGDTELYPTLPAKAAAVAVGLVSNHGFIDGNKRIGMAAMLLILSKNGVSLHYTQAELVELGLSIAKGIADEADASKWIEVHRK